jgi:NAD(P)H dehydrogenase (quinone)
MKHLVVVAHPAEDSFTMGLTRAYVAELEKLGHRQRTYDLYRMAFDPILAAPELASGGRDHRACADVAQAQEDVLDAGWISTTGRGMKGWRQFHAATGKV